MVGLSVGTGALIIILSVFNGFQDLLMQFFSNFNPEIKVSPVQGKTFIPGDSVREFLDNHPDVKAFSFTLEELALFEYDDRLEIGVIKGVDDSFGEVAELQNVMRDGEFVLKEGESSRVVVGVGMSRKLGLNVQDRFSSIHVYMPDHRASALEQPFTSRSIQASGVFAVHHEVDQEYVVAPIEFVRSLLDEKAGVSAIEISVAHSSKLEPFKEELREFLGAEYSVEDHYEQDAAFYRIMQIEKWVSFAIVSLTLVLVAFNLIGALWMIVLEKRRDISILRAMGADSSFIQSVFLLAGLLIGIGGMIIGMVLALVFYWAQINIGLIPVPPGFVVDSYPISLRWYDFVAVGITVSIIGLIGSIWPAIKASKIGVSLRTD